MSADVPARAARAGAALLQQVRSRLGGSAGPPAGERRSSAGWLSVTVLCDPADLDAGSLPAPLVELGERLEVDVREAPGDRGAELSVRFTDASAPQGVGRRLTGRDEEARLRSALRRAKQLIEVGEVLAVDPAPHGRRPATPGGLALESWTENAAGGGVR